MSDKMREAMIDQDGAVWEKIGGAWSLYKPAQSVPVVGEVVAYLKSWSNNGRLHQSAAVYEGCMWPNAVVTPLYKKPTNAIPAAELATLREKAVRIEKVEKERDDANARLHDVSVACATAEQEREELRKALLALKEDCQTSNDCQYGTLGTSHVLRTIDAAIAQGKGE